MVSAVAVERKSCPKASLPLAVRAVRVGWVGALNTEGDQNCSYLGVQLFP